LKRSGKQVQNLGGELGLDFNVSNLFKIPHFYIPLSIGYGLPTGNDAPERYFEIGLGLLKKLYLPRFGFGPLIKGKFAGISTQESGFCAEFSGIGEFYITPDFSIGVKGGYSLGEITNRLKPEGLIWSVYLSYNPPTLPFDPLGFLRGISGI
jgi:hypothetical protein